MLKVKLAPIVIPLLLITTPIVADVNSEMARCQLEAERLYPIPPNKGGQSWTAAGYSVTAECSAPLKTYESCMKIADQIMGSPSGNQYRDADWNRICLDNEWDVRTQDGHQRAVISPTAGGAAGCVSKSAK
jgi:hypothetical protein